MKIAKRKKRIKETKTVSDCTNLFGVLWYAWVGVSLGKSEGVWVFVYVCECVSVCIRVYKFV